MKQHTLLDLLRVWAGITGLLLVIGYIAALSFGVHPKTVAMVPMLVAAIGGFELFLFSQDLWLKRRGSRG